MMSIFFQRQQSQTDVDYSKEKFLDIVGDG